MGLLISSNEVIELAFDRNVDVAKIRDNIILGAQLRHIKPVLGEDFYDLVIATPSSYTALVEKINPPLAYFVKYYILPVLKTEVGTVGMAQIRGQNRNAPPDSDYDLMQNNALDSANMLIEELVKYLNDNEALYPDYESGLNEAKGIEIHGGIVMDGTHKKDCDDYDYTQDLPYY